MKVSSELGAFVCEQRRRRAGARRDTARASRGRARSPTGCVTTIDGDTGIRSAGESRRRRRAAARRRSGSRDVVRVAMIVPSRSSSAARRRSAHSRAADDARATSSGTSVGRTVRRSRSTSPVVRRARRRADRSGAQRVAHRSASPASATARPRNLRASGTRRRRRCRSVSTTSHATPSATSARRSASARAAQLVSRRAEQGERGNLREGAGGIAIERERRLERGERELVDAIRARERILPHRVDRRRVAEDESRPAVRRAACRRSSSTIDAPASHARRAPSARRSVRSPSSEISRPLPRSCRIGTPCSRGERARARRRSPRRRSP